MASSSLYWEFFLIGWSCWHLNCEIYVAFFCLGWKKILVKCGETSHLIQRAVTMGKEILSSTMSWNNPYLWFLSFSFPNLTLCIWLVQCRKYHGTWNWRDFQKKEEICSHWWVGNANKRSLWEVSVAWQNWKNYKHFLARVHDMHS